MATAASGAGEPAPQQMFSWEELKSYVGEVLAMYGSADRECVVRRRAGWAAAAANGSGRLLQAAAESAAPPPPPRRAPQVPRAVRVSGRLGEPEGRHSRAGRRDGGRLAQAHRRCVLAPARERARARRAARADLFLFFFSPPPRARRHAEPRVARGERVVGVRAAHCRNARGAGGVGGAKGAAGGGRAAAAPRQGGRPGGAARADAADCRHQAGQGDAQLGPRLQRAARAALAEPLRLDFEHSLGLRLGRCGRLCVLYCLPRTVSLRACAPLARRLCSARLPSARPPPCPSADVAPPHGAPVKPFHIDPRALSEKAIADALWASIGEAYGLPEARA